MLREIEADLDVDQPIGELSTGQEQIVQIAAAVGTRAQIIVMDEPTSSLSAHESEHLFHLLAHLKQRGITVIYISHRMEEIFQLCDLVTVLRDGRHVATEKTSETIPDRVIHQMIGREVVSGTPKHLSRQIGEQVHDGPLPAEVVQLVRRWAKHWGRGVLAAVTLLQVETTEVLADLLADPEVGPHIRRLDGAATGKIFAHGRELPLGSVSAALAAGIGLLPEDRKRLGLVLTMNCRENTSLATLNRLTRFGCVRRREEQALVHRYTDRLRVKAPSLEALVAGLSGGNQQKIALAKWLARQCDILIVDEPTRGIDVGAKAEIHQLLDELACQGIALLVISSELPEIMNLSRRILVMREGEVAGELEREDFSQARLLRLMAGMEATAA